MTNDEKVTQVCAEAEDMLWEHVASNYPEATTGDLSIHRTVMLKIAMEAAIKEWVELNA